MQLEALSSDFNPPISLPNLNSLDPGAVGRDKGKNLSKQILKKSDPHQIQFFAPPKNVMNKMTFQASKGKHSNLSSIAAAIKQPG